MSNPTELAARTYVAVWQEPDRAERVRMVEACFAEDGRLVSRGTELRGRAALIAAIDQFLADPRGLRAEVAGAIDVQGAMFRFRSRVVFRDGGGPPESFDAGLVDPDGRIALLLAFAGPLA